jgi:DNA transposition AAA+ family ATPase
MRSTSGRPDIFPDLRKHEARKMAVPDPTMLILIDEADRLQMSSLEPMRSIFDEGIAGMVLIGMPASLSAILLTERSGAELIQPSCHGERNPASQPPR